jgi:hypothetical protein
VTGSCEKSDQLLGFVKEGEFLDHMSDNELLK